jgi:hypothetical protein
MVRHHNSTFRKACIRYAHNEVLRIQICMDPHHEIESGSASKLKIQFGIPSLSPEAKFMDPDWGDKVLYGIRWPTLSPSQGLGVWLHADAQQCHTAHL